LGSLYLWNEFISENGKLVDRFNAKFTDLSIGTRIVKPVKLTEKPVKKVVATLKIEKTTHTQQFQEQQKEKSKQQEGKEEKILNQDKAMEQKQSKHTLIPNEPCLSLTLEIQPTEINISEDQICLLTDLMNEHFPDATDLQELSNLKTRFDNFSFSGVSTANQQQQQGKQQQQSNRSFNVKINSDVESNLSQKLFPKRFVIFTFLFYFHIFAFVYRYFLLLFLFLFL
jgi:hypothetical protein